MPSGNSLAKESGFKSTGVPSLPYEDATFTMDDLNFNSNYYDDTAETISFEDRRGKGRSGSMATFKFGTTPPDLFTFGQAGSGGFQDVFANENGRKMDSRDSFGSMGMGSFGGSSFPAGADIGSFGTG